MTSLLQHERLSAHFLAKSSQIQSPVRSSGQTLGVLGNTDRLVGSILFLCGKASAENI
ncbi:MAG: hypothetical protein WC637_03165 [Victivallales bacterium]|jgi:hypothetical protein